MKFKAIKTQMRNEFNQIVSIGYCNAQYLLNYEQPIAYSTRADGWACDYYEVNNVLISTGYVPLASRNTECNYDLVREYDDKAREIVYGNLPYEEKKEQVRDLLNQFVSEVA